MKRPHHRSDWLGHWTDQKEMRQILSGLMHRRADSSEEEMASELNQTRHRLVILVLIAAYVFLINSTFTPEFSISPGGKMVLIYYGFYTRSRWACILPPGAGPAITPSGVSSRSLPMPDRWLSALPASRSP